MTNNLQKTIVLFLCPLVIFAGCSHPPPKPQSVQSDNYHYTKQYAEWKISEESAKHDLASMTALLSDKNGVVWESSVGFADKEAAVAATPESLYRVGSVTKLFTATAIMQLHDAGKLDVDASLNRYLPEFSVLPPYESKELRPVSVPTLRQMMTHHSGLPSDIGKGMWNDAPISDLLEILKKDYMAFEPGTLFSYSNVAISLLGEVIGKVSGQSYEEYVRSNILLPLEMKKARIGIPEDLEGVALPYHRTGKKMDFPRLRDHAAGDLFASARGLANFAEMMLNDGVFKGRRVISSEIAKEMWQVQNQNNSYDRTMKMGLGWFISEPTERYPVKIVSHGGATIYHHTFLAIAPDHGLAAIVMSNSAQAGSAVAGFGQELLKNALESKAGIAEQKIGDVDVSWDEERLSRWQGYYATPYGPVEFIVNDGEMRVNTDEDELTGVLLATGNMRLEHKLFGLVPITPEPLKQLRLELFEHNSRSFLAFKNGPVLSAQLEKRPLSPFWLSLLGEYEVLNPDQFPVFERVSLEQTNGLLKLSFFVEGDVQEIFFLPESDQLALTVGMMRGSRQVMKAENEKLVFQGYEIEKID